MFEAINSSKYFWYAIKRWIHGGKSWSNLQLGEDSAWVYRFILEIVNYLVKLEAFSVHVMHYMHYVGLR